LSFAANTAAYRCEPELNSNEFDNEFLELGSFKYVTNIQYFPEDRGRARGEGGKDGGGGEFHRLESTYE
jgi:hypothetical protein